MSETPAFRNPDLPVETRVNDLLSRMTIEERVGQMLQLDGRVEPEKTIPAMQPGSMLQVLDEDAEKVQRIALANRMGVPLLLGIDAIHGHSFKQGATIFPTQIGLACMWNTALLREVGGITALEMSFTGVHWTFSPVLCIARDARWGRVGETFGEDPYLIGEFASALINGYQGAGLSDRRAVLACAKHFAGYSETQGGLDSSEADLSIRNLRAFFLPGFEKVAREGCATFMAGYQAIEGMPCSANSWLLTDLLKKEWGFEGVVVTDWDNVRRMHAEQHVFANIAESSIAAAKAGNDLIMATPAFYDGVLDGLKSGRVTSDTVDQACRRILRLKFAMGLFEDPRLPDPAGGRAVIGCAQHRDTALQTARESIVLLKNANNLLPLDRKSIKRIAVIGPNADDPLAQLGDWTLGTGQAVGHKQMPRDLTITVLDGIRAIAGKDTEVLRIERGDKAGMQRLIEYISRCPFSLGRMVALTEDGKILYRASHANCLPFPISGDKTLMAGIPRNFEVFEPLDFLAEVVQHIPNKGDHLTNYCGWYSNKKRGMRKDKETVVVPGPGEPDTAFRKKSRMTWAALIKAVFEVDPLKCPKRCTEPSRSVRGCDAGRLLYQGRHCDRADSAALQSVEGHPCARPTRR